MKPFSISRKKAVLIVSDDVILANKVALYIDSDEYKVIYVPNCLEAINICKEQTFHLILCDLDLMMKQECRFVKVVKSQREILNMPIIAFTGEKTVTEDIVQNQLPIFKEYGIKSLLMAPFKLSTMKLAIEKTVADFNSPKGIENSFSQSKSAYLSKNFSIFKSIVEKIYKRTPDSSRSNFEMALAYQKDGNTDKMNYHLNRACAIDGHNVIARCMQYEQAILKKDETLLDHIPSLLIKEGNSDNAYLLHYLAKTLFRLSPPEKVIKLLMKYWKYLETIPNNLKILQCKCFIKLRQFKRAYLLLKKLTISDPKECIEVFNLMAIILRRKNQIPEAIKYYKMALKRSPNDVRILFNLALAYLHLEEMDQGIYFLKKVLSINTSHDRAEQLLQAVA